RCKRALILSEHSKKNIFNIKKAV
ncbi:hypothetical protein QI503_13190, partial [Staphylococcus aureus]|nr:hypothetical protein [Staphylococcus aureus]